MVIKTYFPKAVIGTMTSSLLFITNTIHLSYKQDILYCYTFACLSLLSILYHLTKNRTVDLLDKLCIAGVVLQGGKHTYLNFAFDGYSIITITTYGSAIWIYHYGFITHMYVFDKNEEIGNNYHMLLHLLSSIGHHAIACKMQ